MKKLLICLMALVMLMTGAALAEITAEKTVTTDKNIFFSSATGCYYARSGSGYQIFDPDGNALSEVYGNLTSKKNGLFYEYYGSGLNNVGLLDARGQVICEPKYGDVTFVGDHWGLGYVLEPIAGDIGDFKDSDGNRYMVVHTDVYYDGKMIGTLSREEYNPSCLTGELGGFLYIKETSDTGKYLDRDFNITYANGTFSSFEFTDEYKKGVFHNPTQTYAFCEGCTLTPEDVTCPVWYDDDTDCLIDLQGNVIKSGVVYERISQSGEMMKIRHNRLYGLMDLQGNVIVAPAYQDISTVYGTFNDGHQMAYTEEGHLHFLDEQGNVTAKAEFGLTSYSDYKGYNNNAAFAVVKNLGKYIVVTATHGQLPTQYDDMMTPGSHHKLLVVKQGDAWGAIDTAGNTVIPFIHDIGLTTSADGMVLTGRKGYGEYYIYRLSEDASVAPSVPESWTETKTSGEDVDTTPALAEGAWECVCGTITTGKFCPECGSKKPEPTATPAPAVDDGSWNCSCGSVNTGKFCPECGAKKPEAAATPAPEPQCASCGYKPEGAAPKFCPECGTKF